jgi:hypothetical protein
VSAPTTSGPIATATPIVAPYTPSGAKTQSGALDLFNLQGRLSSCTPRVEIGPGVSLLVVVVVVLTSAIVASLLRPPRQR